MKQDDMKKLTESIQQKLGQENSALINDDLAQIILDNNTMNTELEKRDNTINDLKKDKEDLMLTNSRLFQQVTVGEEPKQNEKEDKKELFSLKNAFDEKGNFIN